MLPEALACTNVPIVYDNSHVMRGIFVNNICGAMQWGGLNTWRRAEELMMIRGILPKP